MKTKEQEKLEKEQTIFSADTSDHIDMIPTIYREKIYRVVQSGNFINEIIIALHNDTTEEQLRYLKNEFPSEKRYIVLRYDDAINQIEKWRKQKIL